MIYLFLGCSFGLLFNLVYIALLFVLQKGGHSVRWGGYMWTLPIDIVRLRRYLQAQHRMRLFWTLVLFLFLFFVGTTVCVPLAVNAFEKDWAKTSASQHNKQMK